jgi:hypothetical protein
MHYSLVEEFNTMTTFVTFKEFIWHCTSVKNEEHMMIYLFTYLWLYWGLNSVPHACWAGPAALEVLC